MKKSKLSILFFVGAILFVCSSKLAAQKSDIDKLSPTSKKALEESAEVGCSCLKENRKELKNIIAKIKPIIAEAEKAENPMEVFRKMGEAMKGIEAFADCMKDARPGKGDEAAEKALKEDMDKIMGEDPDFKAVSAKRKDISLFFLKKKCRKDAKLIEDFMKLEEEAKALRKKKREEEGE